MWGGGVVRGERIAVQFPAMRCIGYGAVPYSGLNKAVNGVTHNMGSPGIKHTMYNFTDENESLETGQLPKAACRLCRPLHHTLVLQQAHSKISLLRLCWGWGSGFWPP